MIAVVILNWNGADMLRRFLPSVVAHTAPLGEVIVADNGSTDSSIDLLQTHFPDVRIVRWKENLGFAEGYNEAFRRIESETPHRHDLYLLLNSDVRVTPDWLSPLRNYMDTHPDVAAAQPKLLAEWAHDTFEYAGAAGGFLDRDGYPFCRGRLFNVVEPDNGQYDSATSLFWATGAALLIRADDWHAVGGLDGRFFAHNEEIDLCWRLRARGRKIVCVPQSVVFHVGGGTLPKDNPRKTYLNFRNNLTMLHKNLPETEYRSVMFRRALLDAVALLKFALSGDFANARAVWRGVRDFRKWRHNFDADRRHNLAQTVLLHIPERTDKSLLWAFFFRRQKTFSQFLSSPSSSSSF